MATVFRYYCMYIKIKSVCEQCIRSHRLEVKLASLCNISSNIFKNNFIGREKLNEI